MTIYSQCNFTNLPQFDASVGVELWVSVYFLHSDGDSAGARVAAEVVAGMPGCEQAHLEHLCVILTILSANVSRHDQHHAD